MYVHCKIFAYIIHYIPTIYRWKNKRPIKVYKEEL